MYRNFDLAALETQYSPSSCIDDINIYIQQYIQQSQHQKHLAQSSNTLLENLSYGASKRETLDLFLPQPQVTAQRQLMVYIHGGYWQELSKEESCFAAYNFQQHGVHFAVLNYDLAPKACLSEIVEQIRRAIAWLYHNANRFGFQKEEIYLCGSSAGAHLTTIAALTNWHKDWQIEQHFIKGICAVSGIYDLTPIEQTYINAPLQLTKDEIAMLSPLLTPKYLPRIEQCDTIIAVGENETLEFKRQSVEFFQHVKKFNINCQFAEIAQRNHFDVILDLADKHSWLFQQILKQMQ